MESGKNERKRFFVVSFRAYIAVTMLYRYSIVVIAVVVMMMMVT